MLQKGYSFKDAVENRFKFGSPFQILMEEVKHVHKFRFDEIKLFKKLNLLDPEYLKILYMMEVVSRARIACFIKNILSKESEIIQTLEKLSKMGFYLVGVIFGSTGRFEATEKSDFEYLFLYHLPDDVYLGPKTHILHKEFLRVESRVKQLIHNHPEFRGVKICGIIERWGITRSYKFAIREKRTWPCNYFLSYCFYENPQECMKK